MSFINCGAYVRGGRPKTKKALKEALKTEPERVRFDCTSLLDEGQEFMGDAIPPNAKLSVVGPDPYTARNWYATVQVHNGVVKVS